MDDGELDDAVELLQLEGRRRPLLGRELRAQVVVEAERSSSSGVNVCQVYDRRRYGSDSSTICSGSAIVTPWLTQVIGRTGLPVRVSKLMSQ